MRQQTRKAFKNASKSGTWEQYKRYLTKYNKAMIKSNGN